jgi:hypothetical protein
MSGFQVAGDLALNDDQTDMTFVQGVAAVSQSIRTGAFVFRGLWVYDTKAGIPYLDAAFDKDADLNILRTVFRTFLLNTRGVSSVDSLELTFDDKNRILYVDFTVRTDAGEDLTDSIPFPILH